MNRLVLEPTPTAQWHQLVNEAQRAIHSRLDEELESYLVFLLMRFTQEPRLLAGILALEYLESHLQQGKKQHDQLRDVGDRCLLFSGLFPQLAERRRVRISYYVHLGQGAYSTLSSTGTSELGTIYAHLASAFVHVMDVLQAMRRLGKDHQLLTPLEAFELWSATGSRAALKSLQDCASGTPVPTFDPYTH